MQSKKQTKAKMMLRHYQINAEGIRKEIEMPGLKLYVIQEERYHLQDRNGMRTSVGIFNLKRFIDESAIEIEIKVNRPRLPSNEKYILEETNIWPHKNKKQYDNSGRYNFYVYRSESLTVYFKVSTEYAEENKLFRHEFSLAVAEFAYMTDEQISELRCYQERKYARDYLEAEQNLRDYLMKENSNEL